ncbi:50S ribosomal protein L6 [Candidatus Kaiserbacteria bacterium]|nr:50S ribosomal protein L6 [Candidatus Kaiserbacteria bacterium]
MSRLGKKSIHIPSGTEVAVSGHEITVKGKNGTLKKSIHPAVSIMVADGAVSVSPATSSRLSKALWGTYAAHVGNMLKGASTAFSKKLEVQGIGYKVELSGKTLNLSVGFSHPVKVEIPEGISVTVEKNTITISGADKDAVGQFAANVRAIKKPEPYKGKGIRYEGEVVRMKEGKKAGA